MSKKKKHHYIPRFYLKRFSIGETGKNISLYNHKNKIFINAAPIKHQGCENYLYGEDEVIENALAKMESEVAKMFYYWTEEKLLYPPPKGTNGYILLKRFIIYQANRTPSSGRQIEDSVNESMKTMLKAYQPNLWQKLKDNTIGFNNPVLKALIGAIENEKLLDFLDFGFVVNLSLLPFVTSDSPVVLYNQLMEKAGNYIGATGLVAKGLQVFYPIHPRLMICLYDSNVYEFNNGENDCGSTESIDEVHQLNSLQIINSDTQIFFNDFVNKEYAELLFEENESYRNDFKNINTIFTREGRNFFFMSSKDPHINLSLDFFKLKVNPKDFNREIAPLRHPSLDTRSG